jgi:chromosome segregation ATPase
VARGAADKPKIVGKSASKLAPATIERLAAQGFKDLDALIVRASLGEDDVNIDVNKLVADLSDVKAELKTSTASITALTARADAADAALVASQGVVAERDATIADLNTQLEAANGASRADEAEAAITYLKDVLKGVRVASGKEVGELPATVADLTAAIDAETSKLTAILPVNGVSQAAGGDDDDRAAKRDFSAFKIA